MPQKASKRPKTPETPSKRTKKDQNTPKTPPKPQKAQNTPYMAKKSKKIQKSQKLFFFYPKNPQKYGRFDTSGSPVALFVAEILCALDAVKIVGYGRTNGQTRRF